MKLIFSTYINEKKNLGVIVTLTVFSFISTTKLTYADEARERISRKIASVEEEVITVPITKSNYSKDIIFQEDDSGVMKSMKDDFYEWEKKREFVELWDLEGLSFYEAPTQSEQKEYLSKRILRYLDRRLSGEMKKAEEGSALHTMKVVEKNLRPDATVALAKNFSVKFKFRVLQGKLITDLRNPWIESNITVGINGKMKFVAKKSFNSIGITAGTEYSVTETAMLAYVDKDFSQNVKGRISSHQEKGLNIFGKETDARIEVVASFPFNM